MAHLHLGHHIRECVTRDVTSFSGAALVAQAVDAIGNREVHQSVIRGVVLDLVEPVAEPVVCFEDGGIPVGFITPPENLLGSDAIPELGQEFDVGSAPLSGHGLRQHRVSREEVVGLEGRRLVHGRGHRPKLPHSSKRVDADRDVRSVVDAQSEPAATPCANKGRDDQEDRCDGGHPPRRPVGLEERHGQERHANTRHGGRGHE